MNTLGAIAGAFGAGFVLIPKFSTRFTILFARLCVVVAGLAYQPEEMRQIAICSAALAAGVSAGPDRRLMFVFAPRMNLGDLSVGAYDSLVRVLGENARRALMTARAQQRGPEVHKLLMYEEGPTSTVSVRKDWDITSMAINGRTNASDREDMPTQVMLGQIASAGGAEDTKRACGGLCDRRDRRLDAAVADRIARMCRAGAGDSHGSRFSNTLTIVR